MPDQLNPPCAVLLPGNPYVKYGITMGEGTMTHGLAAPVSVPTEINLGIMVVCARSSVENAQEYVDALLGLEPLDTVVSIPLALDENPTLDGLVEWVIPRHVSGYDSNTLIGNVPYFTGRIELAISVTPDLGN